MTGPLKALGLPAPGMVPAEHNVGVDEGASSSRAHAKSYFLADSLLVERHFVFLDLRVPLLMIGTCQDSMWA